MLQRRASFDREGRGAAGLSLGVERIQPHVLHGKEEPRRQTRPLDADGGRGLGHQLVAPPGPYRERAGETSDAVGLRWYGRGAAQSGVRCVPSTEVRAWARGRRSGESRHPE